MGMVGGGLGSFIGPVHRMAATLDGEIAFVAGAFGSSAESSRAGGARYGLDPARVYDDWRALFAAERERPDPIDFVAITAPNHVHFPAARAALEAGFAVLSDKPATATLAEALTLAEIVAATGRPYGLTYTYTGYAMVRHAREMVRAGTLGAIRKVVVEYEQGWLSRPIEQADDRQAKWRTDPATAGIGGCLGDIGVHAHNLAEFVTGERVIELCAEVSRFGSGRTLDDDANVLLRFAGGARGVLISSQISAGARNGIRLRVYGENAGLEWSHENPDRLTLSPLDEPQRVIHAGMPGLSDAAQRATRLPTGHPEGLIEAFANIYRDFAASLQSGDAGERALVPGIDEGVRGMTFIDRALRSGAQGGWVGMDMGAE
jgi:predicted dehydrogenase